jgi:nucleoside-diphosphate-sugar epimerase
VLKLRDEAHFARLAAEKGIPLALIRVFNLAGPYINKVNTYALSSIILDVLRGGPVTLRASHPVIRSYVSIFDVIDLALCALAMCIIRSRAADGQCLRHRWRTRD